MKKKLVFLGLLLFTCVILYASDGTVVLTSSVERRNLEPLIKPVWEHVITATYDSADTNDVTQALNINGILLKVILTVPNTSSDPNGQVVIKDNGDNTIFDSGEQDANDIYTFNVFEPLSGTIDVVIGPSGSTGTDDSDVVVTIRGI